MAAALKHKVGWIGAGRMGFQLATRLLEAGADVTVFNRTRAKAVPLTKLGAKLADSPLSRLRFILGQREPRWEFVDSA